MVASTLDEFCGSPFWDEQLTWNATHPDLTPCFQATVLTWVPCAFLWLLAPLECYFQKRSHYTILPWTGTNIARMFLAFVLAILCAINVLDIIIHQDSEIMYAASIASSSLKSLTFLFSIILMLFNKKHGRHTSGILFLFWLILTISEIFQYRSAFIQVLSEAKRPDDVSFVTHMIYFPLLIAEFLLSCLADVRYKHLPDISIKNEREESPEMSASFLSILTFWWFNHMSYLGWKRPLVMEDLYGLHHMDKTELITENFEKYCRPTNWRHTTAKSSIRDGSPFMEKSEKNNVDETEFVVVNGRQEIPKKKINVVKCLVKTFWAPFLVSSICKFFYDLLQFVNPMLLKLLITFIASSEPQWIGIVYACCMFINGTVQSAMLGSYFHRMFVLGMRVRTALVTAIYKKSLLLSTTAKKESTVGEIVNLMSVDSQRFMDLLTYLNMLWSAPLQITIALILLYEQLGPSVFAGLAVMILIIPFNLLIASKVKAKQAKQMKNKDERVKLINEVLSGIKVLKLYAWELAFKKKIDDIRDKEVKDLRQIAYLNAFGMLLWSCSPFLVALASFTCFVLVKEENVLNASTAFVSLSLFNVLRFPLTMLPHLITALVMTRVSVKRINKYMNSEELEQYVIWDSSQADPISVHNGEFSWSKPDDKDFKPILKSINLNVNRGSLVAIVGQVGSGKSSLLSAILGDMTKLSGTVSINGKTALVSQQPWIQNSTLQDNILFSDTMDKQFYKNVIEACGLKPDLEILPGGDQTEIGEKGINLSGGQKQRVSLARAVYSNADVYLFDDPLSAVDSHVGKHIFEKVIGPKGLLNNKTRVLVTHGLTYLPQVDIIYVMKDGVIAEKGSYQELIDSKGPFAEFLSQYLLQVQDIEEDLEVLEEISKKNPELLRSLSDRSSIDDESDNQSDMERKLSILSINRPPLERSHSKSVEKSVESTTNAKKNEEGKLTVVETAETGKVKWLVYWQYLRSIRFIPICIIFVAHIGWQVCAVSANVWLSEWGNDKHLNGSEAINQRNYRLGVYGAFGFGEAVGVFTGAFAMAYGTLLAANWLHNGLLLNVLKSPMSFFDTTPIGRIVNRFAKDIDTIDVIIPMTLRSWLSCLLQVLSTMTIICINTPIFILVVLPVGVLYYFIQRFYVSTSRQLKRLESITKSPIYSHFSETLTGASTIRAYRAEERFCKQSNTLVDNNQICYYPSITANRWLSIRLDFCGNTIILFAALLAVLQRDSLSAGKIGLSITYALMITQTMNWLVRMTSELETNIVAVERILEYSVTPTEAEWVVEDHRAPSDWPQKGGVIFDNYSTRYRTGLDLVLKDICCNIKPGEKIGIVGRTGAGKSSLTLCLFRIIEAVRGSIELDEEDIGKLGLHDLRSRITIIPQDPVLFSGTLRMNLDPFDWYSDAQLWEALDHAHLKVFVSTLDAGLNHDIVEGGENLSVGQRQLVCLARALLRKTKILVLDEATAAVDLETDSLIQATIRKEFENASVLTIAHRLNTVMDYDRIMVLDKGEVAEFDGPQALLKKKQSIFYGMAKDAGLV